MDSIIVLRRCVAAVFALAAAHAAAQNFGIDSDPDAMAQSALGKNSGYVAVGAWHNGKASFGAARGKEQAAPNLQPGPQLFEIGSISKVFTGLLLAQEVEQGRLALDDTLGKLLGKQVNLPARVAAVTLRQLVTHSSCLPRLPDDFAIPPDNAVADPYRDYDRARLWASLSNLTLKQAPPCTAVYSNYGVAVLGEIISAREGKPWETLVQERITGPLGMHDTVQHLSSKQARLAPGFDGDRPALPWEFQAFAGAGSLRSSAADMLVFGRAMMAGRAGPLGAAAERAMQPLGKIGSNQIGYAIMMRGPAEHRYYYHNGGTGGYVSYLAVMPDTQDALVVLAGNAKGATDKIGNQLLEARYRIADTRIELDPARVPQYAGVFRVDEDLAFTFVAQDGQLYGRLTGQSFGNPLTPSAPDMFTFPSVGAEFTFTRANGKITEVTLRQRGGELAGRRVDEPVPARAVLAEVTQEAYGGDYVSENKDAPAQGFKVVVRNGQLLVQPYDERMLPVFPVNGQADRFASDVVKAEIKFEKGAGGLVNALVLYQDGKSFRALRVPAKAP